MHGILACNVKYMFKIKKDILIFRKKSEDIRKIFIAALWNNANNTDKMNSEVTIAMKEIAEITWKK